jgi:hypothetical protein
MTEYAVLHMNEDIEPKYKAECERLMKQCEELQNRLDIIARMKIFPDDVANRYTLLAAIKIAKGLEAAL